MVVHGIPSEEHRLEEGDLISVDVGVTLDGFVADSAYTFAVGEIEPEAQRLLDACQAALDAGIAEARAGNRIGDLSAAVQRTTEEAGFSVVKTLVGHGVGRSMHEEPQIPNYGEAGRGPELAPGMTLAIEPMITAGGSAVRPGGRRLVDHDRRRLALGALRAHRRRHGRRPANPDDVGASRWKSACTLSATMIVRGTAAVEPCLRNIEPRSPSAVLVRTTADERNSTI